LFTAVYILYGYGGGLAWCGGIFCLPAIAIVTSLLMLKTAPILAVNDLFVVVRQGASGAARLAVECAPPAMPVVHELSTVQRPNRGVYGIPDVEYSIVPSLGTA
jgi:hypothetical protein